MDHVINPITKRRVKIGSRTHRDLIKKGVIQLPPMQMPLPPPEPAQLKTRLCPPNKVMNPTTKRCISKNARLYQQLLKQGVKFHDDDIPGQIIALPQSPTKLGEKKSHTKCKNQETFLYQQDITTLDKKDLLVMPSGYCFSVSEILEWLNSGSFTNKNPYDNGTDIFSDSKTWKQYPELSKNLSIWFNEQKIKRQNDAIMLFTTHMDLIYKIGDTGRICIWDNNYSHEKNNSATFEHSIHALAELAEDFNNVPVNDKPRFKTMTNYTLKQIIDDANNGTRCIHGIGYMLLFMFLHLFQLVEASNKDVVYDYTKTNMLFVEDPRNTKYSNEVLTYNIESRLVANRKEPYYFNSWFSLQAMGIKYPFKTSLVWKPEKVIQHGLSSDYSKSCPNEVYMSSLDSKDEWIEITDWRKFKTQDGYCFDLFMLIKTITNQLNTCKNLNPFPQYPSNVFTRTPLMHKDLINLRRRISTNYLAVANILSYVLYNPDHFWSEDHAYIKSGHWTNTVIDKLEIKMRYTRHLHSFNGKEDVKIEGCWEYNNFPVSIHETGVLAYINTMDTRIIARLIPCTLPLSYYIRNNLADSDPKLNRGMIHGYPDFNDLPKG